MVDAVPYSMACHSEKFFRVSVGGYCWSAKNNSVSSALGRINALLINSLPFIIQFTELDDIKFFRRCNKQHYGNFRVFIINICFEYKKVEKLGSTASKINPILRNLEVSLSKTQRKMIRSSRKWNQWNLGEWKR